MYKYMKLYKHMYIYTYMSKADPGPAHTHPLSNTWGMCEGASKQSPGPKISTTPTDLKFLNSWIMPQHVFTGLLQNLECDFSIEAIQFLTFLTTRLSTEFCFCFLKNQEELPIVYNSVEFNISNVFQLLFYRNNNVYLNDWMLRMIVQFNCESFLFPCSCWKILSQYENPTHIWAETPSIK